MDVEPTTLMFRAKPRNKTKSYPNNKEVVSIEGLQWAFTYFEDQKLCYVSASVMESVPSIWSVEFILQVTAVSNLSNINNFYFQRVIKLNTKINSSNVYFSRKSDLKNFVDSDGYINFKISVAVGMVWWDDLSKPTPFGSTLVAVCDRELYVSGPLLCLHSTFFRAMLQSDFIERMSGRCDLRDGDVDGFILFLLAIYPTDLAIDDANMEKLLELGDQYDCHYLMQKCTDFILYSGRIPRTQALQIADGFHLPGLFKHIAERLSVSEMRTLTTKGPTNKDISDRVKLQLFDTLAQKGNTFPLHLAEGPPDAPPSHTYLQIG